jgi:hypothetical protein
MKGALSDRDIEFLQDTVSRLGNTKEAIKIAFAQLEANKLVDQVVYSAYMSEPDKANFPYPSHRYFGLILGWCKKFPVPLPR